MSRGARRASVDFERLAQRLGFPGIDPRNWIALGRVDADPDAVTWETPRGWLVDVTFTTGALAGLPAVPCRVATSFAEGGGTRSDPPQQDCEVIVAVPSGDTNDTPVILAFLHNGDGCEVPEQVNDSTINEALLLNTHVVKSPHAAEEQYDGARRVAAGADHTLEASATLRALAAAIHLGGSFTTPPTEAALLGNTYTKIEGEFLTELTTYVTAVSAALSGLGAPVPPATLIAKILEFQIAIGQGPDPLLSTTLSKKVKLE